jgi:hypothetical protein
MDTKPTEVFRGMLTGLSNASYWDVPLSERGCWLPTEIREALAQGWIRHVAAGTRGEVEITDDGRDALARMPYPPSPRQGWQ